MKIKKCTTYTLELDGELYPLPFNTNSDPEYVYQAANGLTTVLAFLVRDECPGDPFDEFNEGDFYQFDPWCIHNTPRPDIDEFKRLVRANPGRVVTVDRCGDGYRAGELVTVAQCRNKNGTSEAESILDEADGYYIAPEDVTDAYKYAQAAISQYSAWCEGDVYGVIIWTYTRASISEPWGEPDRDNECWGYYGYEYASEELQVQFKRVAFGNDPSIENNK